MKLLLLSLLMLSACSSHTNSKPELPKLISGKGIYTLRHNPTACLMAQPELEFEIVHEQGTERVYIELSGESNEIYEALQAQAAKDPEGEWAIFGRLKQETFSYAGGHYARIFSPIEFAEKEVENE